MEFLDPITRDVLWTVAHYGPYLSSVMIAADMTESGRFTPSQDALAWMLVEESLATLNTEGLVIYSLADHGVMIRVRCTPEGYEHTGMPHAVREVGAKHSRGGNESDHPGDPTDWRNHGRTALGTGPIEKMPLRDHIGAYWDHAERHLEQLWELEDRP